MGGVQHYRKHIVAGVPVTNKQEKNRKRDVMQLFKKSRERLRVISFLNLFRTTNVPIDNRKVLSFTILHLLSFSINLGCFIP